MRILQFVRNPQEKVDKIVIEKYYEVFANLLFTTRREDQMKGHEWVTNGEEGTRGLRCPFFSPPPQSSPQTHTKIFQTIWERKSEFLYSSPATMALSVFSFTAFISNDAAKKSQM